MKRKDYEKELRRLQVGLCHLQEMGEREVRRARLNCIAHLLETIPFRKISRAKVRLPKQSEKGRYNDQTSLRGLKFVTARY